jgi:hypothetical protein
MTPESQNGVVVLADVTVVRGADDRPSARGVRELWMPRDEDLEPIAYEHTVPR